MKKYFLLLSLATLGYFQSLAQAPNAALNQLADIFYENQLQMNPLSATQNGDNRFNDQLSFDFTDDYRAKQKAYSQKTLASLKNIPLKDLNDNDRLSYEILKNTLELNLEGLSFPENYIPLNQFQGFHLTFAQYGSGSVVQPFKTVKDYANWEKRMHLGAACLDSSIVYFKKGLKANYVLPKALVLKLIGQLESFDKSDITQSTFYGPLKNFPASFSQAEKEQFIASYSSIIEKEIIPAYRRLAVFIKNEYLPKARATSGAQGLPDAARYYQYKIRQMTTTNMSAKEIHAIGLKEVKRIQEEMEKTKKSVGFSGDLKAFFHFIENDPQFMPFKTEAEVIEGYYAIYRRMENKVKGMFGLIPKTRFEVRATEAFRAASAAAQYNPGLADGSRPGIFYVPILDATKFNNTGMESLFLHEAIPGHHYQVSLQRENTSIPAFRRFGFNAAYGEGWGLYAESLGKDLGLYTDPYQYMGALGHEIHRAIRLVVDTGLHSQNMSREEAIEYMMANEPISLQKATAEIERYMTYTGQALSYKIGELKIKEIRARLEKKLGQKFNLSQFHDEILKDGRLPLDLLSEKMDRWANKQ
ncbi:DUF885 domain-containing protein [Aquirufa ecclesiirivi]|uniref:DUF885 domain-containing protein n=1 Tax=Aquirufa ecclesiirivi TaxID=2715124 RepID=UPI003BB1B17C